jgi:thiol-disulfide isomerase/thioredoxin
MTEKKATSKAPASSRRLVVAAAGVAAVSGLGLGWWKFVQNAETAAPGNQSDTNARALPQGAGGPDDPLRQFWLTTFDTPSGGKLPMASFQGKPLLVNFWATWCPPCVEELPLINAFYQKNKSKSWQVMGIAADQLKAVNDFMVKFPLSFPVALAGMAGVELSKSLGNLSGGLPFTVIFGRNGTVRHRQIGRVTADHLAAWRALE